MSWLLLVFVLVYVVRIYRAMPDEALWNAPVWHSVAFIDGTPPPYSVNACPQPRFGFGPRTRLFYILIEVPEGSGGSFCDAGMMSSFTQDAVPFTARLFCEVQS